MPSVAILMLKPDVMLSLNDRRHWSERAKIAAEWRKAVWARLRSLPQPVILGKPAIRIDFGVKSTKVRRDADNAVGTTKHIVDGMRDAHWIADDSVGTVDLLMPRFTSDVRADSFLITITWEDPE